MAARDENNFYLKASLHILFFLSGIATVLIGQVLPILSRNFALDDQRLGYFFPAQFAGSLIGTYLTGWFGRREHLINAALLGGTLMAAGIATIGTDVYWVVLAAFFINGLGIGLTLPAINLLVIELNPERSAAALSLLNFFWGVGAIVSKPFVDVTTAGMRLAPTTVILATAVAISVAACVAFRKAAPQIGLGSAPDASVKIEDPIWILPTAWAIAFFNFIHVGFESGMSGWLTTYSARIGTSERPGLLTPTFIYFSCFVIGRALAPSLFRFFSENTVIFACLGTILVGMVIALAANDTATLSLGAATAGLGTSAVFPTNVSRFYRTFGTSATRRATPLFLAGTLGGATVTYLIGYVSSRFENLRPGMFVLLLNVLLLIVIQAVLTLRKTPETQNGENYRLRL